jgi:nicotinate-nucleotide adenylyltransferase
MPQTQARRRIGLLGGSFNPAHGGHLHISRLALRHLDLDEVWWLVSPQNPLKKTDGMAPFATRFAVAEAAAKGERRIVVSDIEERLGTTYTADTLAQLRHRFPRTGFVWLMGGDNLAQIPRWQRWTEIFQQVPIAVFDRPATARRALAGAAALRYAKARIAPGSSRRLAGMAAPAWVFFPTPLDPHSATEIRARQPEPPKRRPRRAKRPAKTQDSSAELLRLILASLDDSRAEDVVTVNLAGKTAIADYMVIASGRSSRQVAAMTDHLADALRGHARVAVEGKAQGDWVLVDAGDIIINLFRPEIRLFYNLEKMWGEMLPPDVEAVRR